MNGRAKHYGKKNPEACKALWKKLQTRSRNSSLGVYEIAMLRRILFYASSIVQIAMSFFVTIPSHTLPSMRHLALNSDLNELCLDLNVGTEN